MAEPCTLTIHRTQSGYLVRIAGRGTMRESPALRDFACGAIADGAQIVVDLSACEYLDSTFLGCLVLLHKRGTSGSRACFSVYADQSVRRKLLGDIRLLAVLIFTDEYPECIGAPVSLEVTNLGRAEFCRHLLETHRKLAELGGPSADTFRRIADQLAEEAGDI